MTEPEPGNAKKTTRKEMSRKQRMLLPPAVWLVTVFTWFVRLTCRVTIVQGRDQIDLAHERGGTMIPCGWHQRLLISGIFLAKTLPRGMRAGFLISPSREGEFIARVASNHGTSPVRGSSSHGGGTRAYADTQESLKQGISPMMFGDGPRGPAREFKRGAVVLAQRSGQPMMPLGVALNRYWQIKSWDKTLIPKPFAHFTVAVGELWYVNKTEGPEEIDRLAKKLGDKIDELTTAAEAAL